MINPENVSITAQGFEWKTTSGGTYTQVPATGTSMSYDLAGLSANTSYTYRAFVTTEVGTRYGEEKTFTTLAENFVCGASTLKDADNNTYHTLQLGSQCWMAENLRTTKYADGTTISLVTSTASTGASSTSAYRYYPNNTSNNVSTYGYLYNWPAVMGNSSSSSSNPSGVQGVCPTGWHVPSYAEWNQLTNYVGGKGVYLCSNGSGNVAKALSSKTGWYSSTESCAVGNVAGNNNATCFGALPAGTYTQNGSSGAGSFVSMGMSAQYWSSTEYNSTYSYSFALEYGSSTSTFYSNSSRRYGLTVRCLRNETAPTSQTQPNVTTSAATNVQATSATLRGSFVNPENATIVDRGFEWKATSGGTLAQVSASGSTMTYNLSGLTPSTSYTYRAYVTTSVGTKYGAEMTFTTLAPTQPTVTTSAVTNITTTSATLNGSISNPDNLSITAQGFQWKTTASGTYTNVSATGTTMSYDLTGLSVNTNYTYRAFVTTASGTIYGAERTFTTQCDAVTVTITGDLSICVGKSTVLTASTESPVVSYAWSTGDNSASITVSAQGVYSVTVSSVNGCQGFASVSVMDKPSPIFTLNSISAICENTTQVLSVTGSDNTYEWSTGSTDQTITISTGGLYTVSATNIYGCEQSSSVYVTQLAAPTLSIMGVNSLCQGSSTTLIAVSDANQYLWSTGDNTQTVEVIPDNTTYSVTVTGENGCSNSAEHHITSLPVQNESVTVSECGSYTWHGQTYTESGDYTYSHTVNNGCTQVDTLHLTITNCVTAPTPCIIPSAHPAQTGSTYQNNGYNGANHGLETVTADGKINSVTDYDGNEYPVVQIGSQCWLAENMRCTHSPITGTYIVNNQFTSGTSIDYTNTGKMARWYDNDSATYASSHFGLLYNWNAAVDVYNTSYGELSINTSSSNAVSQTFSGNRQGICPKGWHVPSDAEWTQLTNYVGSQSDYLCSNNTTYIVKALASTTDWNSSSNTCDVGNIQSSNNATGFGAMPAGIYYGQYSFSGENAYFWSATEASSGNAWYRLLYYGSAYVSRSNYYKILGCSVRCLRDSSVATNTIKVTRVEGQGNGGLFLDMTDESREMVLANNVYNNVQYKGGQSPICVEVIDSTMLKPFDYIVKFLPNNVSSDVNDSTKWQLVIADNISDRSLIDNGVYTIVGGDTVPTRVFTSMCPISVPNEQIFPQLGISISIRNANFKIYQQNLDDYVRNGSGYTYANVSQFAQPDALGSAISFSNDVPWLSGLVDQEGNYPSNWIRAGQHTASSKWECNSVQPDQAQCDYVKWRAEDFFNLFNSNGEQTRGFMDPNQQFEGLVDGTWAPYVMSSPYDGGPKANYLVKDIVSSQNAPTPMCYNFTSLTSIPNKTSYNQTLTNLYSVDIVLTPDKNLWTRAIVLEAGSADVGGNNQVIQHFNGQTYQNVRHEPKNCPSVDKDGNPDNSGTTGLGWFPGYAINVETGERLNIMFAENSEDEYNHGNDMIFNPTNVYAFSKDFSADTLLLDANGNPIPLSISEYNALRETYGLAAGEPLNGGRHYVYVVGSSGNTSNLYYSTPSRRRNFNDGGMTASVTGYTHGGTFTDANGLNHAYYDCGPYDQSVWLKVKFATLTETNYNANSRKAKKMQIFNNVMWTGIPMPTQMYEDQWLSSTATIKLRVSRPYMRYSSRWYDDPSQSADASQNSGYPMYVFSTKSSMTVTTFAATNLTSTFATLNGFVYNPDNVAITAQGFEWRATTGGTYTSVPVAGNNFTYNLTGLTPSTNYTYRAFVTYSGQTVYGNETTFTTEAIVPTSSPCTPSVSHPAQTAALGYTASGANHGLETLVNGQIHSVTDYDGNEYPVEQIGSQCWLAENMRCTRYANGFAVPVGGSSSSNTDPYYYDYSSSNIPLTQRGYLYNWPAAMHGAVSSTANPSGVQGICPNGWHLPSDAEWNTMEASVSGSDWQTSYETTEDYRGTHAGKLAGGDDWNSSITSGSPGDYTNTNRNSSGFSAVPAGYSSSSSSFSNASYYAYFWSSSQYEGLTNSAWYRCLNYSYAGVYRGSSTKRYGRSVRCLRDADAGNTSSVTSPNPCTAPATHEAQTCSAYQNNGYNGANHGLETVTTDGKINSVTDYDGNEYPVVQIGSQCWLAENMRCTHSPSTGTYIVDHSTLSYSNNLSATGKQARWYTGTVTLNGNSVTMDSAACVNHRFGLLYNWNAAVDTFNTNYGELSVNTNSNYAVNTTFSGNRQGICPTGWHVPSNEEWTTMEAVVNGGTDGFIGDEYNGTHAGKLSGGNDWNTSHTEYAPGNYSNDLRNASGFSAVPAGIATDSFYYGGDETYFWSSSSPGGYEWNFSYCRSLNYNTAAVVRSAITFCAVSVRCLRDGLSESTILPTTVTAVTATAGGTTATLKGTFFNPENRAITAKGFEWKTSGSDTYSSVMGIGAENSFTSLLTGLTAVTEYTYRAFIIYDETTVYGEEKTFTTTEASTLVDGQPCPGTITLTDIDNNTYNTVQIGEQCWMKENLRTTRFADGTPISIGANGIANLTIAYLYDYSSSEIPFESRGYLYNWAAVMHGANSSNTVPSGVQGICPNGWHVPSDAEWTNFTDYVSNQDACLCDNNSNYFRKSLASEMYWRKTANTCGIGNGLQSNNATGFSAVPAGGYFGYDFSNSRYSAEFWSSSLNEGTNTVWCRELFDTTMNRYNYPILYAWSVRCLRDEDAGNTSSVTSSSPCTASATHPAQTADKGYTANGANHGLETVTTDGKINSVTDYDGNEYPVVQIGSQCWLAENMRCTHSPLTGTYIVTPSTISNYTYTGKQARWYTGTATLNGNFVTMDSAACVAHRFGLLYNWNAAVDVFNTSFGELSVNIDENNAVNTTFSGNRQGICPRGWHVPTDAEWNTMELVVNGSDVSSSTGYRGTHAGKLAGGDDWNTNTTTGAPGDYTNANRNSSGFSVVPAGYCSGSSFYDAGNNANFWTSSQNESDTGYAWNRCLGYGGAGVYRDNDYGKSNGFSVRCLRD